MDWIRVEDRLPDIGKDILFVLKTNFGTKIVGEGARRKDYWIQYGWDLKVSNADVTHWMPLPEPPKEG